MQRFARFQAAHQAERISEFKTKFGMMARALASIRALAQETDRQTGRAFNIFRVLGMEHLEVRTHSAFLAQLLDPEGTHGQGHLFLHRFLAMLSLSGLRSVQGRPFPAISADLAGTRWHVTSEKKTAEGNLDLVLESPHVLVVIENKIYAGDRTDQVARYARWLRQHCRDRACALLYLTREGHPSTSAGDEDYYTVSYRREVRHWLNGCIGEVPAPRIRDTLQQYLDLVASL